MTSVVVYIRVSVVGKRGGDSFLSPDLQRQACERYAAQEGLTIAKVVEELDRSAAEGKARPLWDACIEDVVAHRYQGLLVWNLERFSRSVVDASNAIKRIEAAGGKLYSTDGLAAGNDANARQNRNMMFSIAQGVSERAGEGFVRAQLSALERGVWMAAQVPDGYTKNPETRHLEIDPERAAVIVEMFEHRAEGWSWSKLARWYVANGGAADSGYSTIRHRIRNEVYLGHTRWGDEFRRNTHEPIVTEKLWDTANAVKGTKSVLTGRLANGTLLGGIPRCVTCDRRMGIISQGRDGVAAYGCRNPHCSPRASMMTTALDTEVVTRVMAYLNRVTPFEVPGDVTDDAAIAAGKTAEALAAAEYSRSRFIGNTELRDLMEPAEYNDELRKLNGKVNEARADHLAAEAVQNAPTAPENLSQVWETYSIEKKRKWLQGAIRDIIVLSANGNGRLPVAPRVAVRLKDGVTHRYSSEERTWLLPDGLWSNEPFGKPSAASGFRYGAQAVKDVIAAGADPE